MVGSNGRGEGLKVTHSLKISAIKFVVGNFVLNPVTAIFEDLADKVQDGRHAVGGRGVSKGHEPKRRVGKR